MRVGKQKESSVSVVSDQREKLPEEKESHTRNVALRRRARERKKKDLEKKNPEQKPKSRVIHTEDKKRVVSVKETTRKSRVIHTAQGTAAGVKTAARLAANRTEDMAEEVENEADPEYSGNNEDLDEVEHTGKNVKKKATTIAAVILKEVLLFIKMIVTAMSNIVVASIVTAAVICAITVPIYKSFIESTNTESGAMYEYHCYNQHNYTGQANKACGVTAAASALRSLGLQITPDMLEQHNNGLVGLWYGADAWVNNHYPVKITRGTVSAETIDEALQHGSLCVVYLHNNCDVSSGSSQWNTGRNVSGGGCHWITLIGYTEAGLIAALDPADGTGNEEYCKPENCEGGTTSKAISMDEVMESCSNIYVITPTETREDNEKLLAALIYSEAGASYEDKLAVGTVVMNRLDMQYGDALTLEDVIYAPYQFEGTKTDNFRNALANGAPAQCQQVAYEILQEGNRSDKIPSTCVSFMALSISESEMRRRTGCTNFIIIDQRFGW